jgi:predicted nucleic acid-binding protein
VEEVPTRRDVVGTGRPGAALLTRATRVAFDLDHPIYDCVYLTLATQYGARLATADGRLRRAATRLAVSVWQP